MTTAYTLDLALREAARIAMRQHDKLQHDVEVVALYTFGGPGDAFVVWIDRDKDGTWMVSSKRNALPQDE